jgi:hypothetical protein
VAGHTNPPRLRYLSSVEITRTLCLWLAKNSYSPDDRRGSHEGVYGNEKTVITP